MSRKFHTPSLGDDILDLTDCEPDDVNLVAVAGNTDSVAQPANILGNNDSIPALSTRSQNRRRSNEPNTSDTSNSAGVNVQPTITMAARKQLQPTGYTAFFRETASAVKKERPEINFNDLSQIIKPLWQALPQVEKARYNDAALVAVSTMSKVQQKVEEPKPAILVLSCSDDVEPAPYSNPEAAPTVVQSQSVSTVEVSEQSKKKLTTAEEIFGPADKEQIAGQLPVTTVANEVKAEQQLNDETAEQMLTVASAVHKCTQETCNKRAIINPDWEDEYCSNECVILHCRGVFNSFVASNKKRAGH